MNNFVTDDEIRLAIAETQTASEALGISICLCKARNPKKTLGFLARESGIPSTGYLSDVASGRRQLHAKYQEALLNALGIFGTVAEFVRILITMGRCDEDSAEWNIAEKSREDLRKLLRQQNRSMPERLSGLFFAFEVFAAFGLTGQKASRPALREFFGVSRGVDIDRALALLTQSGLIELRNEEFCVISDQVNFFGGDDGISHLEYLTMAIRDAETRLGAWFGRKDESFFLSSILSVKDKNYRNELPKIKDLIRRHESDLESGDADRLVRFNVQIYPLR